MLLLGGDTSLTSIFLLLTLKAKPFLVFFFCFRYFLWIPGCMGSKA